jgi:hypothetical protein
MGISADGNGPREGKHALCTIGERRTAVNEIRRFPPKIALGCGKGRRLSIPRLPPATTECSSSGSDSRATARRAGP